MAFIGSAATPAEFQSLRNGIQVTGDDIIDGSSNVIYDQTAGHIPNDIIQYTSLSVDAGNGLQGGGSVSLNGNTTISINTSDIVGEYLSQSADVIGVNLGEGLTGDGSDNIIVDETHSFSFTKTIQFDTGLNVSGDISDGTNIVWDSSNGYIPASAIEQGDGSGLDADTVDGIQATNLGGGVNVSNGGAIVTSSSEDLNFTFALEASDDGDGTSNIKLDESINPTWTGKHTFNGGIEFGQLTLPTDPGNSSLANAAVTSTPAQGDEQSYSLDINSEPIITAYSEADGSGGIQNKEARVNGDIRATGELTEGSAL